MTSQYVEQCSEMLAERQFKLATVESATAGRLASEFALSHRSGDILLGGLVCYDACIKQKLFNISEELVKEFTPESAEVTEAITKNLRQFFDADVLVGVTGLTSAGGSETPQKPVGTMFFHIMIKEQSYTHREVFKGNPEEIMLQAIERIAQLIMQYLKQSSH